MAKFAEYTAMSFNVAGMAGIEQEMLEQHLTLYKGYVTNANKANGALAQMLNDGKADSYEFSETRRRLGFEYSGMRLHEVYFAQMKAEGSAPDAKLSEAVAGTWGSWEAWTADIVRTGMMRGIGWAVLYKDPVNGALQNFYLIDHENAQPAGLKPVFALDIWEHAYVKQFGAGGRKTYIEAFLKNVDWSVVASRL